MRKPLVALSLAIVSLGALPAANTLAALPATDSSNSPHNASPLSANDVSGAQIVQTAMKYLGYPYTATGNSPSTGFSCIGFASYVYRMNGIPLPGDLSDAYAYAPKVAFSQIEPGDLLFFQGTVWPGLSHVAIYMGGGRFIHAAWYNTGVEISSFTSPNDGAYWTQHYLGANRPWGGSSVGAVTGTGGTSSVGSPSVAASPNVIRSGPTAIVSVYALNVRFGPSKRYGIVEDAHQGDSVTILKHRGRWYRVQLSDGRIGWVVASGIGKGSRIGNPTSPAHKNYPSVSTAGPTVASRVNGLNVHASPGLGFEVVSSVSRGERLQVLARSNGWVKVRLPNGKIGWVDGAYLMRHRSAGTVAEKSSTVFHGRTATGAFNVHTGPALGYTVETVIPVGGSYKILHWSHGWAQVLLSNGKEGWVSGTVIRTGRGRGGTTYHSYKAKSTVLHFSAVHHVTAGVRVHSRPGLKARVIGLAARGTHVEVLGYVAGWVHVRLPTGQIGYIDGPYVT
ncbi:MAG: SH3 domain-containing protein [Chloroflexota bacterium]